MWLLASDYFHRQQNTALSTAALRVHALIADNPTPCLAVKESALESLGLSIQFATSDALLHIIPGCEQVQEEMANGDWQTFQQDAARFRFTVIR